ncbi:hypothetical protein CVT26_012023 [Gymnopilus dilepis]|uniref:Uncharacterized protein n=1 Tax=Gymnopilus dilepis TaxID=231916 RepID=A0A409YHQ1_9AGAR|nr:hypothetical protein CVT26_012023 [Gymnopilus dilepis]
MSTSSSSFSSSASLSTASSSSSSASSLLSSTSNVLTTTTATTSSTTSSQSDFIGFSSSTFFPFSPPPSTSASTPSPFSQISTPHPSPLTNVAFSTSRPLVPSSQSAIPTPGGPNRDAQATSDTGTTWTPGEIALIAVCSFIILLAILACGLVIFVRRRLAKKEIDRQFDFHMPSADRSSNPRRGSVGSVEKYGNGDTNDPEGVEKRSHKGAPAYLAGLGGVARHKRSLSTEAQAEAETSGTAPLLMRKVRPASSRHSHAAVYGDEESRRSLHADQDRFATPLTGNGDYEGREMHEEHAEDSEPDTPREPSPPSSPSLPLLASASSPALNASFSRHTVPAPPSAWRSAQIEVLIPPVPLSPPPPSPDQQKLINDLESVQNLYTLQHPPSRRSSKATRRSSRRAFADVNANANGYDSDDSESMYSQASAPASASAPSLISSKSVKSIYGRQSRTGQGLMPQTSGNAGLGIGVLPPIPQSPFATQSVGARTSGSGEGNGSASQRDSLATVRASLATTASTSTSQPTGLDRSADLDDEDEGNPLSNPDKAMYVAKLLQSRQKNTALQPAAPGTPSRSSSLVSHIERTGSIRPVLALDSVEEQSEAGSTLGRRSQG